MGLHIQILGAFQHILKKGHTCPWHEHEGVEIVYHPTGCGWTETGDGVRRTFTPGSLVFYPRQMPHTQGMETPGVDLCLVLNCRGDGWGDRLTSTLLLPTLADAELAREIHALTSGGDAADDVDAFEQECRAGQILCAILRQAARNTDIPFQREAQLADAACRLMVAETERLRRPRDVARELGISEDYLRHVFKAQRGCSLQHGLLEVRMKRALQLVRHSPLQFKAIAFACGFETPRYFCTAFKARYGQTPGSMRQARAALGAL